MAFPSDPYKICKSHPELKGQPVGGSKIPLRMDNVDIDGDGKPDRVVEHYESVYICPNKHMEETSTVAPLADFSTVKSGALKFFSLDGKSAMQPFKSVVTDKKGEQYVTMDFGYDEAISWNGEKAEVDRSKITVFVVPLAVFKKCRRMAREAEEKRSEELAAEAQKELMASAKLFKLGEVSVSAVPFKLD
ncbi:MAG: hypothetical protein HN337_05415 [Deltaproteobacteria bacterium]|jgi:hypothetical protein|nr:hypothetical protein [Deltaproteobacteria bacterium]